ncbi:MAG TPA: extracellular solute-binding protein, partial [Thermodesulfobacteriota bacterium]|nr:extracellular solute-binding protein [Thermodesulfobacteriota bacterium]
PRRAGRVPEEAHAMAKRSGGGGAVGRLGAALVLVAAAAGPWGAAAAQEVPAAVLEAAKKEGTVVVYGTLESEIMKAIQEAFEARYGVKTEYWRAASTRVLDRALTESRAGRPLFDVVLANATPMKILAREGILARYAAPSAAALAQGRPAAAGPEGEVLSPPYRMTPVGILYNTRLVRPEEAPRRFADLLDPRWKGKLVMPDPTRHATTATWLANLDKLLGPDAGAFVQGLAAQRPILVESFIPAAKKVLAGEAPVGISYIKFAYVFGTKEGAPLDYARVSPVLGEATHIGVGAKAPRPHAARLFVNFFLSRPALSILAGEGEFVLLKGVYPPLRDAEKIEIVPMDELSDEELRQRMQGYRALFS